MSTNYPGSLDSLTDTIASGVLGTNAGIGVSAIINNLNDAVEAIEAKLGATSSAVTTSHDYKLGEVAGSDKAVGKTATQTLTNKTLTAPTITGPTITGTIAGTPTITTPTITKPVMDATNPTAQTYAPSAAGTATLDLSLSNQHRITMPAGNITIALSNATNSQIFLVSILQDATGSRTVTWFSTIRWVAGTTPTLTTTANKRDYFCFIRTGSGTYDGFIVGQNI